MKGLTLTPRRYSQYYSHSYCWGPKKGETATGLLATVRRMSSRAGRDSGRDSKVVEFPYQQLALQIYKELRRERYSVWMDVYNMGNDLKESMREGIRKSRCVVVLLSPEYVKSKNCRFELDFAAEQRKATGKPILTCMVVDGACLWSRLSEPDFADACGPDKLDIAGTMYCEFGPAAGVNWGASGVRLLKDTDRELLTHYEGAMPRLRTVLEKDGILGSDTADSVQEEHYYPQNTASVLAMLEATEAEAAEAAEAARRLERVDSISTKISRQLSGRGLLTKS